MGIPSNFLAVILTFLSAMLVAGAREKIDNEADLRRHFTKAPRSVANALKQGAAKEKVVIFIIWHEDVPVRNGIDWWLHTMLAATKVKDLLESQAIITALPVKKFRKHTKFLDGKEEWSQPYLLFVDGDTETVVWKTKAHGNSDAAYKHLTKGLKQWLDFKAKQ